MTAGQSRQGWRRVLACIFAYALAVQGLVFAIEIGSAAAASPNGPAWAGFELCERAGAATQSPGLPAPSPIGNIHCVFCVAGAVFVDCTPPVLAQTNSTIVENTVWPIAATHPVKAFVAAGAWPRGPPASA